MILTKFGVPKKLLDLLRALHNDFEVKFTVDDVISTIACVIGIKQGDILGPIPFTFFIAAVMITWKAMNGTACFFYSKNDAKLTGSSYQARAEKVLLLNSKYADEGTNVVNSIVTHFAQFGMDVHTGKIEPRGAWKAEILFYNHCLCTTTLIAMIMLIYLILLLVMIDVYQL